MSDSDEFIYKNVCLNKNKRTIPISFTIVSSKNRRKLFIIILHYSSSGYILSPIRVTHSEDFKDEYTDAFHLVRCLLKLNKAVQKII